MFLLLNYAGLSINNGIMAICYIKVQSVSFFYILSLLVNALGPIFNQLCDSSGGGETFCVACETTNAITFFHIPKFETKTPLIPTFTAPNM
jgi:hypothetical protein